ncbi:MAG: DUF4115 domain-containing protein [Betaproteobacteria bacterium]|nr:DUF4115 domain-containing protein [Betaproteobacteria bacterium]
MSETDDQTTEDATGEFGVKPGARLAEAREHLKLSATDVARQLKLSVGQVEALETDQFERLPGSVFVRGFIRNYARLVKLDPEDLLQAAGNRLPQQASRPETPPSKDIPFPSARPRRWPKYAWIAGVLVVALACYEFFVSSEEPVITTHPTEVAPTPVPVAIPKEEQTPAPLATPSESQEVPATLAAAAPSEPVVEKAAAPEPVAEVPAPEPVSVVSAPEPVQPPSTAAPESVAVVSAPEPVQPPSTSALPSPEPETPAQASKPAKRQVMLVFEDESWVEIRDRDGKLILFQLNLPGTRQVVSGPPPLSFVIGNPQGVRLTYDERPVDLTRHTPPQTGVARMTLE